MNRCYNNFPTYQQSSMFQLPTPRDNNFPPKQQRRSGIQRKDGGSLKQGEESFEPELHAASRMVAYRLNKRKCKVGEWSYQENQVYIQFLIDNSIEFSTEPSRRRGKVFFRLSKILKRRTPDQCRSHHQKLQIKFKGDQVAIINEVYRKIQKTMVQEYFDYHHRLHLMQTSSPATTPSSSVYLQPISKDAGSDKERLGVKAEKGREWLVIEQAGNAFRVTISEDEIGVYVGHP